MSSVKKREKSDCPISPFLFISPIIPPCQDNYSELKITEKEATEKIEKAETKADEKVEKAEKKAKKKVRKAKKKAEKKIEEKKEETK